MKVFTVCFFFFSLVLGGSMASRVAFEKFFREDPVAQSRRLLSEAGISQPVEAFDQVFLSLKEPVDCERQTLLVTHLGGKIWGVVPQPEADAAFTATIEDENSVILEGTVDSEETIAQLERAAASAVGIEEVENKLTVGENTVEPEWKTTGPHYLKKFLSYSGVKKLTTDKAGLKLEGEVLSREVREKLGTEARQVVSVPMVIHNDLVVRTPRPAVLKVEGTPEGCRVSGRLPSEELRASILANLQQALPGIELSDEIQIREGLREPWWTQSAPDFLTAFFREVHNRGSVEYGRNHLEVSGGVKCAEMASELAVKARGQGLPEDISFQNNITVLPSEDPEVTVYRDALGNLVLDGKVATLAIKNQILGGLLRQDPDVVIKDQLVVSDRVREIPWGDPAKLVSQLMFEATNGALRLDGEGLEIAGVVKNAEIQVSLLEEAREIVGDEGAVKSELLSGEEETPAASVTEAIPPALTDQPVEETVAQANLEFKPAPVYFGSGSSRIRGDEIYKVRQAVAEIRKMDETVCFVIGGYSDPLGNAANNRRLSMKRAEAMQDELIQLGIAANRLKLQYFGEDQSSSNKSHLWKSRRVEISIDANPSATNQTN